MKKFIFIFFILFFFISTLFGKVVLSSQIKNFSKSKVVLHIFNTSDWTFRNYEEKITITLDKTGFFKKEIPNEGFPGLVNFLEAGNKKIYFGFMPGDSLHISVDYKDFNNSLVFTGRNAEKNYFISKYLALMAKETDNKAVLKMKYDEYKKFKETGLKNYLFLLEGYRLKYGLDTGYVSMQKQEILFYFYNDLATFDKTRSLEPYLKCYDTTDILNNRYMKNHTTYFNVITGYLRYKYQADNQQKIASEFQPYYLAYKYLNGELLEKYLAYFLMFNFTYNYFEQTFDSLKSIYFDYRKNHKDSIRYKLVTEKAIDIMLIRKNE